MKPNITRREVEEVLSYFKVTDRVAIVGVRGYYLDSFGTKGENDRGVYDDAIIVLTPTHFETFRANTDPSIYRYGIASLLPGVRLYYKGKHRNRYWALRLVGETAPVSRDGQTGEKIGIALNIHKGGRRNTGSEGCQTLQPDDWDDFIELVYSEMDRYQQKQVPYVLIEETKRRAGAYRPLAQLTHDEIEAAVQPLAVAADAPATVVAPTSASVHSSDESQPPTDAVTVPGQIIALEPPPPVVVEAPPKEGSTAAAAKLVIAGVTIPSVFAGIVEALQSAIKNGFVSSAEVGATVLSFLRENSRFVFYGVLLIIVGMMLKKLYRQITLWLQMTFAASRDHNTVEVIKT